MCTAPDVKEAQQWQAARAPVFNENTEDEEARKRGRRGTILATAASSQTPSAPAGGKALLGQ